MFKPFYNAVFFCICFNIRAPVSCLTLNANYISSVKEKIFTGYDKDVVPTINGKPVEVVVSIYLADMFPTVKSLMHYGINCYFRMRWLDYRLAYNKTENEKYMPFDYHFVEKLWIPNVYFPTLKAGSRHSLIKPNYAGFLYPNGTVLVVIRLSITSFCEMDYKYFPFDIQNCDFFIECYTYPNTYVMLSWENGTHAIRRDHILHSLDFQEVLIERKIGSVYYPMFGTYSQLVLKFAMYRHLSLYILSDFLPCILIVVLSWMSFWINYRSTPARVAFGITTILTSITTTNTVRGESIGIFRSLDYYTLTCNLFVFFALAEYALVGVTEPNMRCSSSSSSSAKSKERKVSTEQRESARNGGRYFLNENRREENGWHRQHRKEASAVNVARKFSLQKAEEEERERLAAIEMGEIEDVNCYPQLLESQLRKIEHSNKKKRKCERKKKNNCGRNTLKSGIFVFQDKPAHIIDRTSRVLFPTAFILFNICYFLYHRLHPDTVDS